MKWELFGLIATVPADPSSDGICQWFNIIDDLDSNLLLLII